MNTNIQSQIGSSRAVTGQGWAAIGGAIGSALLLAKKLLSAKPAKPELMSRADFYAELAALKDHIHAGQLAILDKLDVNHRELLGALERQAGRISTLESGLARVDERTKQGG
jgi:hypothetical protein